MKSRKVSNTIDNVITFFITILIILIFIGIVLFCLDVFGVIKIPEKYSLAALLYSNIEIKASSVENAYQNIPTEDFDTVVKKKREEKTEEVSSEVVQTSENNLDELIDDVFVKNEEHTETPNDVTESFNSNKYYYSQLDEYGKIIYDKLYENKDKLRTGTYTADFGTTFNQLLHQDDGNDILNNSFQLSINALTFDNPEIFYLDITKIYLLTEITTKAFSKTYRVSIGGNGRSYLADSFNSIDVARYSIALVEQSRNEIVENCRDMDVVEKIRYVNNYLIDNMEYDMEFGSNVYNVYGALIDKRAVCEGYARACKYILDELEIPCIIACGIAKNKAGSTENHAWNYVQVNGTWYALDVTWNDPIVNNGTGSVTNEMRYNYFLNGSDKFFLDHFEDGNIVGDSNFQYPSLSVVDYK